ncbi:hypothetical protein IIA16_04950 [bacterium]|nr:hypothetical protein [bacterium]
MSQTTECPYCKETIKSGAYKCRFCNSWLIAGGQEAVDRLAWAEARRGRCESLLAAGDLGGAFTALTAVVERAPEAEWAADALAGVRKDLISTLLSQARGAQEDDPQRAESLGRRILEMDARNDWALGFVAKRDEAQRSLQDSKLSLQARNAVKAGDHEVAVDAARRALESGVATSWAQETLADLGEVPAASSIMLDVDMVAAVGADEWVMALSSGEIIEAVLRDGAIAFSGKAEAHQGCLAAMIWDGEALCTAGHEGMIRRWAPPGLAPLDTVETSGHPVDLAVVEGKLWVGMLDGRVLELREGGLVEVASVPRGLNALAAEGTGGVAGADDGRLLRVPGLEEVHSLPGAVVAVAGGPVAVSAGGEVHGCAEGGWWEQRCPSAPVSITTGDGLAVVAGRFGVRLLGPDLERELGTGAARGVALAGTLLMVARVEGDLEVWNLSRWLG